MLASLLIAAVRGQPPAPSAPVLQQCGENSAATLDDASSFLGVAMSFTLEARVYVGGTLVATAADVRFTSPLGLHTPDLGHETLEFTQTDTDVLAESELDVTVELVVTPGGVTFDPHKHRDAEAYAACITQTTTGVPPCTGSGCFDPASFQDIYGAVFFPPGVITDQTTAPSGVPYVNGDCPANGVAAPAPPDMELRACFTADPSGEACGTLTECAVGSEYQTNPGRSKTEPVACERLTVCSDNLERVAVGPTATSDRVCVSRVTQCDLPSGFVTTSIGSAESELTCVSAASCDLATSYYGSGATPFSQPDCVTLTSACSGDEGDAGYESASRGIQNDRLCSSISAECSSRVAAPAKLTSFLDDPPAVDFYEAVAPTGTSDRLCTAATVCLFNETLGAQLTATSDRLCSPLKTGAPPGPPGPPREATPSGTPALIYNCVVATLALVAWVNFSVLGI